MTCAVNPRAGLQVFTLSADAVIDKKLLEGVIAAGHSRVPVHEGDNKQVRPAGASVPGCMGTGRRLREGPA